MPQVSKRDIRDMARRKKVYEGKAKILYEGPEPGTFVQYFKDDATAFNAQKKDVIDGKGVITYQHIGDIRPEHVPILLEELRKAGE